MLKNCRSSYLVLARLLSLSEPQACKATSALISHTSSGAASFHSAQSGQRLASGNEISSQSSASFSWGGAAFGAAVALGSAITFSQAESQLATEDAEPNLPSNSEWGLLSVETKQRLFYKYEKRIRELSTLEKIFDYFASQEKDGIKYMVPSDLVRSIVATFPAYGSSDVRGGSLAGERSPGPGHQHPSESIFNTIDVDGDQLVSFPEYLLLLALLSIPLRDIATVFRVVDSDGNGQLDAVEFSAIVHMLQDKAGLVGEHPRTGRTTGHKALSLEKPVGLFTYFFGEDLKGVVKVEQLVDFLQQLHDQIRGLEFSHYDINSSGSITCRDLAASLVASCKIQQADKWLDRMVTMPDALAKKRVTLAEFKEVAKLYTHPTSQNVVTALEFLSTLGRPMQRADIDKLFNNTLGIMMSASVLETLFHLFEGDDGNLDWKAMVELLRKRDKLPGHRGQAVQRNMKSPAASAGAYWRCVRTCVKGGSDS